MWFRLKTRNKYLNRPIKNKTCRVLWYVTDCNPHHFVSQVPSQVWAWLLCWLRTLMTIYLCRTIGFSCCVRRKEEGFSYRDGTRSRPIALLQSLRLPTLWRVAEKMEAERCPEWVQWNKHMIYWISSINFQCIWNDCASTHVVYNRVEPKPYPVFGKAQLVGIFISYKSFIRSFIF